MFLVRQAIQLEPSNENYRVNLQTVEDQIRGPVPPPPTQPPQVPPAGGQEGGGDSNPAAGLGGEGWSLEGGRGVKFEETRKKMSVTYVQI